jgi:DNA-binding response OmpR family regulator
MRVLVVEDDVRFATLVRAALVEAAPEFEVDQVARLSTALARLAWHRFDAVLTDLGLPDSVGPGTVRRLTRAVPDVPVIVISGNDDEQVALDCVRAGAEEFVVKSSFDAAGLPRLIRLALERHRRMVEEAAAWHSDPLTGLGGPEALETMGQFLLGIAARSDLHVSLLTVKLSRPPSGGTRAGLQALVDRLGRALRRSDLMARVGPQELAVLLVSDHPGMYPLSTLEDVLVALRAGGAVLVGLARFDPGDPKTVDELLERARSNSRPLLGKRLRDGSVTIDIDVDLSAISTGPKSGD